MARGPNRIRQREVARLVRAAFAGGIKDPVIELDESGKVRILSKAAEDEPQPSEGKEWAGAH